MTAAIVDALLVSVFAGVPVALRGNPGIGKTAMVRTAAVHADLRPFVVIGSIHDPTDFAGQPVIVDNDRVRLVPPAWARDANAATAGAIVFLDELTTAPPMTQAAMLRVVLERVVGELPLADHVRIVAAYNDPEHCGGYELELPMRSRFCHLEATVDASAVAAGLLGHWSRASVVRPTSEELAQREREWRRVTSGFLAARPSLAEQLPKPGTVGSYPTPRTWELAARLAATADAAGGSPEVRALVVAGVIGEGAAVEFLQYAKTLDLPDPDSVLDDPPASRKFLDGQRPDRVYAFVASVVDVAIAAATPGRWAAAWQVLAEVVDAGFGDMAAWASSPLVANRPHAAQVPTEFERVKAFLRSVA